MYIPSPRAPLDLTTAIPARRVPAPDAGPHLLHTRAIPGSVSGLLSDNGSPFAAFAQALSHLFTVDGSQSSNRLVRRTSVQDTNVTIGIVVGVLLAVFLAAAFAFMWIYRGSIRLAKKRKHRHRKSHSSKSSKASSDGGPPPAAAPAPAPEAAA